MSFLDSVKSFEHTFTNWVAKEYAMLYKAEPKILQIADSVFKYAIPALDIIVAAEAGQPAAAMVNQIASEAQSALHAASGLVYDFGANPTTASVVAGVQGNLGALLSAGHITNANSVANVNKVVGSLGALAAALATPVTPAA